MTAPLSADLRERLVRAVEAGSSARAAARRFEVSPSAAITLMRRVRATGSTAPAQIGGYRRPLLAGHEDLLRQLTAAKPGITLAELRAALAEHGVAVGSLTTVWTTLRRLGLRHKKRRSRPVSRIGRTSPHAAGAGGSGSATCALPHSSSSTRPAPPRP
jgi:putative transposase